MTRSELIIMIVLLIFWTLGFAGIGFLLTRMP